MTLFCTIFGAACLLYYLVIALYAGPAADFAWFWILLGAAFLLCARLGAVDTLAAVRIRRLLLGLLLAGLALSAALSIPVFSGMRQTEDAHADYIIVLGAQVKGRSPSRALKRRLERAVMAAGADPEAVFLLSGGQGDNEDISEAQCMWEYMTQAGVSQDRLIMEDRSVSTRQNLQFCDSLTGCAKKRCGIVSNNFHVFRAVTLARTLGYTDAFGIPAASDPVMQVHYILRETVALAMEKLRGEI